MGFAEIGVNKFCEYITRRMKDISEKIKKSFDETLGMDFFFFIYSFSYTLIIRLYFHFFENSAKK